MRFNDSPRSWHSAPRTSDASRREGRIKPSAFEKFGFWMVIAMQGVVALAGIFVGGSVMQFPLMMLLGFATLHPAMGWGIVATAVAGMALAWLVALPHVALVVVTGLQAASWASPAMGRRAIVALIAHYVVMALAVGLWQAELLQNRWLVLAAMLAVVATYVATLVLILVDGARARRQASSRAHVPA